MCVCVLGVGGGGVGVGVRVSGDWQRGLEPSFYDGPRKKFGLARLSAYFVGKKHGGLP